MICPVPIRLYPAQKDQNGVRATAAGLGNLLVWVFCRRPRARRLIITPCRRFPSLSLQTPRYTCCISRKDYSDLGDEAEFDDGDEVLSDDVLSMLDTQGSQTVKQMQALNPRALRLAILSRVAR